ncbi:MAG TPA: type III pantothenate kinase [Methylocaldum sp.]|nr:type III pantothenate kinase [Methylocaldum sp.]
MLLLIDIGNSRVKWGIAEDNRIVSGESFPSDSGSLEKLLDSHWQSLAMPHLVYACNVAGAEVERTIAGWTQKQWGISPKFVKSVAQGYGVINGYEQPEKLGVDRWAGLIALREFGDRPSCVADCGTALTFDVLDAQGRHLGGLIAPGLALMKRVLVQETKGINDIGRDSQGFLGRTTAAAVKGGALGACAGLIERSVREAAKELGCAPNLVLTGGDAETIAVALDMPCEIIPDLVLRGLLSIARSIS